MNIFLEINIFISYLHFRFGQAFPINPPPSMRRFGGPKQVVFDPVQERLPGAENRVFGTC